MGSAIQKAVLSACRDFMRPIARLLIKNGIGYREFSDVCKATFVEVASTDHGIRGRKTNMSRVAVMTGLSRKEVKKIRDTLAAGESEMVTRARRPELVLSAWHSDPGFTTKNGAPLRIRFNGPGPNFKELVVRVGGDIPPKAMLNELLRAGSVVQEGEKLRAVSRSYVPEANDPETILVAGSAIHDLASTINHNLGCQDHEVRFFERRVYSEKLPLSQRPRFKKLAKEKSEIFLRDLNAWLSARESAAQEEPDTGSDLTKPLPRIGVGIFFFDDLASTDGGRDPNQ